jgi:hypothetical protein
VASLFGWLGSGMSSATIRLVAGVGRATRSGGSSRSYDVIVAANAARIAGRGYRDPRATIFNEVAVSNVDRQSYVALAIDVIAVITDAFGHLSQL